MYASAIIVPGQIFYKNIHHRDLYNFVDGIFPRLDKYPLADLGGGGGHRYKFGHDLLIDVPKTAVSHGPWEALRHAGHIILTDLPTKAGIPIPGLSKSGLGSLLEQAGIHRGWLQVSLFDGGVGVLAIAEGSTDLAQAIHGTLTMDWGVFFDTFVEGSIEIGLSLATQNPFLLAGGIENLLAGVVATWNELTVYIDPLDLFGSAGISALIGFSLAYGLAGENLSDAGKDTIRSGVIGGLFAISPAFAFGAMAGFASCRLGSELAKHHAKSMNACLSINEKTYQLLVDEICAGNIPTQELLNCALPSLTLADNSPNLPVQRKVLRSNARTLSSESNILGPQVKVLSENVPILNSQVRILLEDPPTLADLYLTILTSK